MSLRTIARWVLPFVVAFPLHAVTGSDVQKLLRQQTTGVLNLPSGTITLDTPLTLAPNSRYLTVQGAAAGTILQASPAFRGRALLILESSDHISLQNLTLQGNPAARDQPQNLPPADRPFAASYHDNGILATGTRSLALARVRFRQIAAFALLASRATGVTVDHAEVTDSGGINTAGKNNTTGGILLEEGTAHFVIRDSLFRRIRGNAVWTHSWHTSPRNGQGLIRGNQFSEIGRDAIQVGHATRVIVEDNTGTRIGFPVSVVDAAGGGTPVAIDTAGNVDQTTYRRNRFTEINGKCIDLDGFHNGEVSANVCTNSGTAADYPYGHFGIVFNNTNPAMQSELIVVTGNEMSGMKYGGIFVIGTRHRITNNKLLRLNLAGCPEGASRFGCSYFPGEPDLLQSGIYLGRRAERPAVAEANVIAENLITGHGMKGRCLAFAPGVSAAKNRIGVNTCREQ